MRGPMGALTIAFCVLVPAILAPALEAPTRDAKKAAYQRPLNVPFPDENPYSAAKVELGWTLFFDTRLSGSGTLSCASCHNPSLAWGDGLPRAVGEKTLAVRTPTLLNVAWIPLLGWDGRIPALEGMTFVPITGAANMNRPEEDLIAALRATPGYRTAFAKAFPDGAISRAHIEESLATFERTIVSGDTAFDHWIKGDENAIGDAAKRGFDLFNGKAECAECHSGWNFTGGAFYDIGEAPEDDVGRGRIFRNSPKLQHAFKVPTLRDVTRRAPYMHDGSVATLEEVIDLYDRGGIDRPSRSELIRPLHLTPDEKADLLAFLATLTAPPVPYAKPPLPR
jgi:cytochrome c peroxidase